MVSSKRAENQFVSHRTFLFLLFLFPSSIFPLLSSSSFSILTFRYLLFTFISSFLSFPFLGLSELFLHWGTSTSLLARKERFHKKITFSNSCFACCNLGGFGFSGFSGMLLYSTESFLIPYHEGWEQARL